MRALLFILIAACATTPAPQPAANTTRPQQPQPHAPHDRVLEALRADGVNTSCVALEDEDSGVIAVREKHGDSCAGDPQTSPVVRRYRVSNDQLQRYDAASDSWN